jgi:peptidoglycan DL-endopeptidase CwlO
VLFCLSAYRPAKDHLLRFTQDAGEVLLMTRARTHIRLLLTGLLLVAGLAAPASADPIADKKAEAAKLAKRIEELRVWAEQLTEQYNKAKYELGQLEVELAYSQAQVTAKDEESSALASRATQAAIQAYLYGGAASGPTQVIEQMNGSDNAPREAYLSTMLGDLSDITDQVKAVRQDASIRQKKLDEQQARKATLIKSTESKRVEASKAIEKSQALLATAKGDLAELVRKEEERRAREVEAAAKRAAEERIARERAAAAASAASAAAAAAAASAARRAPTGVVAPARQAPVDNAPTFDYPAPSAGAARAVAAARSQIGVPYIWATSNPGVSFDCSGLTMWAWAQAGVSMGHFTGAQYSQFPKVPYEAMQPGDLVFFGSDLHHMGIYIGGGMMIDAPHTGAWVRYASILGSDFAGAVRPG